MSEVLRAENIFKHFESAGHRISVLDGVSLELRKGETKAILGASGSGKSTLLQVLGTIMKPDSGSLYLENKKVDGALNELSKIRLNFFGFVFQFNNLLPDLTALENVMLPALMKRKSVSLAKEKAIELLSEVGLIHVKATRINLLSGGEQQRVAIARALMNDPKVLIGDEPTGNLDRKNGEMISDLMLKLVASRGMSMIIATHDEKLAKNMDDLLRISGGKLNYL